MIRVLVADDHKLFADGLREGLEALPDMRVVGVEDNADSAEQSAATHRADVVLMDLEMPGDTLDVLPRMSHSTKVLVVTMHIDAEEDALGAGAVAVFSKSSGLVEMAAGIRAAHAGAAIPHLHDELRAEALADFLAPVLDPGAAALTDRERELLTLLARGISSTEELADLLYISQKTVKNHLASIYSKLSVSDRTQAAVEGIRLGLAKEK